MPGHRDQTQIPILPRFNVENVSNSEVSRAQMCRIRSTLVQGPAWRIQISTRPGCCCSQTLTHSLAKVLIWMQFSIGHVWNRAALKFSLPHPAPTLRAVHNTTCHIEFLRNFKRIGMWTLNIIKENTFRGFVCGVMSVLVGWVTLHSPPCWLWSLSLPLYHLILGP